MKKIFLITMILFGLVAFSANAIDKIETLTFAWEQDNPGEIKNFEMFWGVTAGGPYAPLVVIPKAEVGPSFQSPVEATVTGDQATTETRYFVLKACGDIIQQDGSTPYECSGWSDEVSYSFWIPHGGCSVPIQFRIIPND